MRYWVAYNRDGMYNEVQVEASTMSEALADVRAEYSPDTILAIVPICDTE